MFKKNKISQRIDTEPNQNFTASIRNECEVSKWLNNMKLNEYFDNFINNGFDDMNPMEIIYYYETPESDLRLRTK